MPRTWGDCLTKVSPPPLGQDRLKRKEYSMLKRLILLVGLLSALVGSVSRAIQFSPGMVIENSPAVARLVVR